MPSVKRDIIPITGEEAGRAILLDLAKWADNVNNGLPAAFERKTTQELSDMLYGLNTNEDVKIYDGFRVIQDTLHQWWAAAENTSRDAKVEWLRLAREFELIALAAAHDDAMLAPFKPKEYLEHESLSALFGVLEQHARQNEAQCAAVRLLSEELGIEELLCLQRPLNAFKREEAARLIDGALARLSASMLPGAKELAAFIAGLPEPGTSSFIDPNVIRRAKAVMKQKKPLLTRLITARDVYLGADL